MRIQVYYSKSHDQLYTVSGKTIIEIFKMNTTFKRQIYGVPFNTIGITGITYCGRSSLPKTYVYIGEL